MKRKTSMILIISAIVLLAAAAALLWQRPLSTAPSAPAPAGKERAVLYWTDPMVPGYRSDKPGKSPYMDMDLVPVYAGDGTDESGVTISPDVINNLGVRTDTVRARPVEHRLTVPAYVLRGDGGGVQVAADVFDRDADWVRPGLAAAIHADALPGRQWDARVTRVRADIDVGARSWRVNARLTGVDPALKTGMAVDMTIRAVAGGAPVLSVPREAVIHTGQRSVVIRALDGGRFQPLEVGAGREFGEWVEITRGLAAGERVVVSGQFLIDSEANLRAAFERLATPAPVNAPPAAAAPLPQH